jgi:hypothetical protein
VFFLREKEKIFWTNSKPKGTLHKYSIYSSKTSFFLGLVLSQQQIRWNISSHFWVLLRKPELYYA